MTTLFKSEHIPKDVQYEIEPGLELRCPQLYAKKIARHITYNINELYCKDANGITTREAIENRNGWNEELKKEIIGFIPDRIIGAIFNKKTWDDILIDIVCNKRFCKGEASTKPQQFKCPRCGKLTTFVKK